MPSCTNKGQDHEDSMLYTRWMHRTVTGHRRWRKATRWATTAVIMLS